MARPSAMTMHELDEFLLSAPDWRLQDGALVRTARADSFLEGIAWVDAVAVAAERADHHPDIEIRWRTLTFRLSTHDVGAITTLDAELAREIDAIVGSAS